MAKKANREPIHLQCTESGKINYTMTKDKKKHPERLELKKYCAFLRKHTLHREVKK
ncbi:MAG: 50S ribosomal protein L33 [Candidatus Omnitrophota bacterium]|jgi:large subunit ribosomal protein L33|nr:50S ribosomal protein L33 [Candidatus Omnitrophota bacterium]